MIEAHKSFKIVIYFSVITNTSTDWPSPTLVGCCLPTIEQFGGLPFLDSIFACCEEIWGTDLSYLWIGPKTKYDTTLLVETSWRGLALPIIGVGLLDGFTTWREARGLVEVPPLALGFKLSTLGFSNSLHLWAGVSFFFYLS